MRTAILGCGSIGRRHLQNLQALGERDTVVYDAEPAVRAAVHQEYGVICCETLEEVWTKKPSVALITAPSQLHVRLAQMAAEHDCHLFIEKPLADRLKGAPELCELIAGRGLVSMVACNMRFHPGPARIKRLLEEGVIGTALSARLQCGSYLPRWRPTQDYRQSYSASPVWGGAIFDCIHEIDLALWYFGAARVVAAAHLPAVALGLQTDGLAEMLLRHETGTLSSIHLNFVQRDYRRTCQVIGSEGTLSWDFEDGRVLVHGPDGSVREAQTQPPGWNVNQMYVDEMKHFLDAIAHGRPTANTAADGLATLRVALAAREMGTAA